MWLIAPSEQVQRWDYEMSSICIMYDNNNNNNQT